MRITVCDVLEQLACYDMSLIRGQPPKIVWLRTGKHSPRTPGDEVRQAVHATDIFGDKMNLAKLAEDLDSLTLRVDTSRFGPFALARYYLDNIDEYFALFNACRKAAELA
jgi:hypothetical protein